MRYGLKVKLYVKFHSKLSFVTPLTFHVRLSTFVRSFHIRVVSRVRTELIYRALVSTLVSGAVNFRNS